MRPPAPIVTAAQMQAIEAEMFQAGMPIAALMEKAGALLWQKLQILYPIARHPRVGVLVGPGHNGGDALVLARELHLAGAEVLVHLVFPEALKPLPQDHWKYLQTLGLSSFPLDSLQSCDLLIDGIFGFGLERPLNPTLQSQIATINSWQHPILSIDLPSGIHADTGEIMGNAVRASHTACLGLWKRGLWIEEAAPYVGTLHLLPLGIPTPWVANHLHHSSPLWCIDPAEVLQTLPPPRTIVAHKYQMGHLLLIAGSRAYGGAAILSALGARASGVGMITIVAPGCLYELILHTLPEVLFIQAPENKDTISALPDLDWSRYQAIACGMGLTIHPTSIIAELLACPVPILFDADALSLLARLGVSKLSSRPAATLLTPHWGEFCRLFPPSTPQQDRLTRLEQAVLCTQTTVLLKGCRTAISFTNGRTPQTWINPLSTPALARGGSGDVLSGLIGGLMAQGLPPGDAAIAGTVWHAQTAHWLAAQRTLAGVDPHTLAMQLLPFLGLTQG